MLLQYFQRRSENLLSPAIFKLSLVNFFLNDSCSDMENYVIMYARREKLGTSMRTDKSITVFAHIFGKRTTQQTMTIKSIKIALKNNTTKNEKLNIGFIHLG